MSPAASAKTDQNDTISRNAITRRGLSDGISVHKGERIEGGLKLLDVM